MNQIKLIFSSLEIYVTGEKNQTFSTGLAIMPMSLSLSLNQGTLILNIDAKILL